MNIPCDIIRDLLPLYHDKVCSEESKKQIEEHLKTCESCRVELGKIDDDIQGVENMKDAEPIRKVARKWKKGKRAAFLKGALLVSILACVGCLSAYYAIGSYVASDGKLVEPFALVPLSYLFGLLAVIISLCLLIVQLREK